MKKIDFTEIHFGNIEFRKYLNSEKYEIVEWINNNNCITISFIYFENDDIKIENIGCRPFFMNEEDTMNYIKMGKFIYNLYFAYKNNIIR